MHNVLFEDAYEFCMCMYHVYTHFTVKIKSSVLFCSVRHDLAVAHRGAGLCLAYISRLNTTFGRKSANHPTFGR